MNVDNAISKIPSWPPSVFRQYLERTFGCVAICLGVLYLVSLQPSAIPGGSEQENVAHLLGLVAGVGAILSGGILLMMRMKFESERKKYTENSDNGDVPEEWRASALSPVYPYFKQGLWAAFIVIALTFFATRNLDQTYVAAAVSWCLIAGVTLLLNKGPVAELVAQ